jgi:hypothetical protein
MLTPVLSDRTATGSAFFGRQNLCSGNDVLGPEQIKLLWAAFDVSWTLVKHHYSTSEQFGEVGRLRLANAVLGGWRSGITDPNGLNDHALASMQSGSCGGLPA